MWFITVSHPLAELVVEAASGFIKRGSSFWPYYRIKHGRRPGKTFFISLINQDQTDRQRKNEETLPDRFGVTIKMEDGHKLCGALDMLQVINGIIQVSLPIFIKVDQSRSS